MARVEKQLTKSARSRPVSCQFCRSRKLRCSRQFPCPNCTSRGIRCQSDTLPAKLISCADDISDSSPSSFQGDVLARLSRLEGLVIGRGEPSSATSNTTGSRPSSYSPAPIAQRLSNIDVGWLEAEVTNPGSTVRHVLGIYGGKANSFPFDRTLFCRMK